MPVILIVDDVLENVRILKSLLQDIGQVVFARNGTEALAQVERHRPDIVLLDVVMEGMDGYETCRQLKAQPETSGIPVIFITASGTPSDEALGLSLGAIDYITKPFVEAIVRARVRNHLALVQATAELRRANAELQRLSVTDPLTGVANRRRLMEAGEDDLSRARRAGLPVSVLMLDLDHFKHINDTFGHGAGDEVIKAFSQVCRETVRAIDIVGRLGGEEFAIVLPQTAHAGARLLAERIRERTEQLSVVTESGVTIRFTVSIGVAEASESMRGFPDMLEAADQALYAAKREGRNRVG